MKCTTLAADPATPRVAAPRTARRADGRQRGSVLLLVVVSIVLMTVMGATYLQVARVDRFSMEQIEFESGDIDAVVAASLRQVRSALKDDVLEIDASGDAWFLSPLDREDDDGDGTTGFAGDTDDRGDESIDLPYTNPSLPGHLDDMWLGTTTPRFHDDDPGSGSYGTAVAPVWPHLTSLLDPVAFAAGAEDYLVLPAQGNFNESVPRTYDDLLSTGTALTDLAPLNTNVSILGITGSDLSHEISADWERLGADADRDGVPDARWMYAPIRRIGTTEYVMAARVIDNSSLLNLNAATFLTDGRSVANAFDVDASDDNQSRPRGYLTSDFDLARLAARVLNDDGAGNLLTGLSIGSADAVTAPVFDELNDWMTARGLTAVRVTDPTSNPFYFLGLATGGTVGSPQLDPASLPGELGAAGTPPYDPRGRFAAFYEADRGSLHYGNPSGKYGAADEIELRWGNGINGSGAEAAVEADMPELLRESGNVYDADTESLASGDIRAAEVAEDGTGTTATAAALAEYFQGGPGGDAYALREFPAIRHLLTTYSGVDAMIPNVDGQSQSSTTPNDPETKFSLLFSEYDWSSDTYDSTAREQDLFDIISEVFRQPNDAAPVEYYLDTADTTQAEAQAAALSVAVIDAMDREDTGPEQLTSREVDGIRYHGTERILPILREALAQAGWVNSDELDETGASNPGTDGYFESWTFQDNSEAIAVEIGNPFDREINLDEVSIRLRTLQDTNADTVFEEIATYDLTGQVIPPASDIDPAAPNNEITDQRVFFRQADVLVSEKGGGSNLATDLAADASIWVPITSSSVPFQAADGDIRVELQIDDGSGSGFVTYDQLEIPWPYTDADPGTPAVHPAHAAYVTSAGTTPGPLPTAQLDSHAMSIVARDGRGLYYLTNFSDGTTAGFDDRTPSNEQIDFIRDNAEVSATATYGLLTPDDAATSITALGQDRKELGGTLVDAAAGAGLLTPTPVNLATVFDNRFALSIPDRPFLSTSEIGTVFVLGFTTDTATGELDESISTRITNAMVALPDNEVAPNTNYPAWHRAAYLDISPEAVVVDLDGSGNGVPHAALLLDRLTTIDPVNDDRDNDADDDGSGAGVDETPTQVTDIGERRIPGVMNINTVPAFLAALATPLPEHLNDAEGLFRAIAAYRDYPIGGRGENASITRGFPEGMSRTDRGIVSIGELMFINGPNTNIVSNTVPPANVADAVAMQTIGRDDDPNGDATTDSDDAMDYDRITSGSGEWYDRYDIVPMPEVQEYVTAPTIDGGLDEPFERRTMLNGPEERLARFQFLANLFSTRSDVFTAYVVIRGYQSGAYELGPTEQAHYIAVFDRSGLRDADTPVRLVAFERVQ